MKRADKITFGKVVAQKVADFEYGVVFRQEGAKALQNNKFRKFIKRFGVAVSGGNRVMFQALKNTKFAKLYENVKGQSIAVFFNDKDCIEVLNSTRRVFKEFSIESGYSKEQLQKEILQSLSKSKNDSFLYAQLVSAISSPIKKLCTALEKLVEHTTGTSSNVADVEDMLNKLSLQSIYNIGCKILENIK